MNLNKTQLKLKSSQSSYYFLNIIIALAIVCFWSNMAFSQTTSQVSISEGDEWHYYKGHEQPPQFWNRTSFDVSNWLKGQSGIGYGTGTNNTVLTDMNSNYSTIYARRDFNITNIQALTGMNLSVVCDGPFIAFLNGKEMIRTNTIQASVADQPIGIHQVEQYNVAGFIHELIPSRNVLSIQCENDDITSADFSFIPAFEVLQKEEVQQ